ncbi:molybdenum cofactor guanylyltransferase [Nostoc sp. PA-18-2419]|uniref:molybdenum cofactor guanylyltransferase n=1 Tax=Nostoc sp. PA-18-2419 TaxID=2575443 RepID=UPI0011094517
MGEDKALIPIQGVPLLQRVCGIAKGCADTVYIVTSWPERYQHLVLPGCEFIREMPLLEEDTGTLLRSDAQSFCFDMENDLRALLDFPLAASSVQTHGPLVGFAQGLFKVETDWVLLLACDLPRLRVEVLQEWATKLDNVADNAIAALAHHPKGWEPLCGFYRRCCLPELLDFINQGGRSFQQWLQQYPVEVLPLPEPDMLFNCNTPADLALS